VSTSTTRTAILDVGRRLLEARGYDGIGLDTIAREAGVSRQAVYLHFKSKAGLLLALVEHVDETEELAASLAPIERAGSAVAMLDAVVEHIGVFTPRIYRIATALDGARRSHPEAEAAWQDRMANRYVTPRRIVQRLAAEGVLAAGWSRKAATDFVWALTSIRVWEDLVIERGWSKRDYVQHVQAVLRATLVDKSPTRARKP
jgi:AcrR family transcriptional regulator